LLGQRRLGPGRRQQSADPSVSPRASGGRWRSPMELRRGWRFPHMRSHARWDGVLLGRERRWSDWRWEHRRSSTVTDAGPNGAPLYRRRKRGINQLRRNNGWRELLLGRQYGRTGRRSEERREG